MKKKYLLLLMLVLIPCNVKALSASVTLTCDSSTIKAGGTTTCYIKGNATDGSVSGVSITVKPGDSNLSLEKVSYANGWMGEGNSDNDGNIELYTSDYKTGTFDIATIVLKAASNVNGVNSKIVLSPINLVDSSSYNEVSVADVSKDIRIPSNVNTLSSIVLSSGTLSPAFSADVTSYTAVVDDDSVSVSATTTDSKAKVANTGEVKLNYGVNLLSLNVTSESGNVKTYKVSITRPDNRDSDNTLSSLKVDDKKFTLSEGVTTYTLDASGSATKAVIEAKLNSDKASFVEGYEPRTVDLKDGKNEFEIRVKAENEKVLAYKIVINKKGVVSSSDTNPKTGDKPVLVVIIILIVSAIVGVVYYERYKKKERGNKDEKK